MAATPPSPGLSKVRKVPFVGQRSHQLLSVLDGWWAQLLERADVVSEGCVAAESGGPVYYGTTNLRCRLDGLNPAERGLDPRKLSALLLRHPHTRLRLLRLARREASGRATGPIGVMHAEIHGRLRSDGAGSVLDICIDVSAGVCEMAGALGE